MLCVGLSAAAPTRQGETIAETVLPGESRPLAGRLAATDRLVARGEFDQALDEFQRLLDAPDNPLVPLDPQAPHHLVNLRRLVHARLAALPERVLRLYRLRVDTRARQWLTEGRDRRDRTPLRRVIDEAFCASPTAEALDLLGDLEFERGNFDAARRCWRRIAPPGESAAASVLAPLRVVQPQGDAARARAKQILVQIFQGGAAAAASGLAQFRKQHPQARGHLAGRDGIFADLLQDLLARSLGEGPPGGEPDWSTFGGNAARTLIPGMAPPRRLWMDRPGWTVRLDRPEDRTESTGVVSPSQAARQLAFFPLVVDDLVLVSDACFVKAYDRQTGRPVFVYDLTQDFPKEHFAALSRRLPAPAELRYTLTATEDALFARLGRQKLGPRETGGPNSYLVCLELRPGFGRRGARRWVIPSPEKNGAVAAFEGAPVVHDGLVCVAHSRFKGGLTQTDLIAYRAEDGAEQWRQEVCVTAEFKAASSPRYRHHLLTLAGPYLVYCSHSGAIVAVDAATGRPVWARRYPSRTGTPSARDLGACVYHADRVYVAPADSSTLFCLDVETGRILWARDGLDPVHLIGVADDRLLFTTAGGLRAVDARTGSDRGGWAQPDVGRLPPFGRALAAGGWIFWLTQDDTFPVRALSITDGNQERDGQEYHLTELRRIRPGNLAYAHGTLVVADTAEMTVYPARK